MPSQLTRAALSFRSNRVRSAFTTDTSLIGAAHCCQNGGADGVPDRVLMRAMPNRITRGYRASSAPSGARGQSRGQDRPDLLSVRSAMRKVLPFGAGGQGLALARRHFGTRAPARADNLVLGGHRCGVAGTQWLLLGHR